MQHRRLLNKKTIVVTGGLGFIGSHFIDLCLLRGHTIINIDKETYAANVDRNLELFKKFPKHYAYQKADISALTSIPYCDIIVNFAAESHVDNSINGNDIFMRSNVLGVHRMLEILKNNKIENLKHSWVYQSPLFVQISTDEVFGDILCGEFKEDDRHLPSNPYSATKSCAEQLVVSWGRTYDLPYMITRTTNNYGPRQHSEKLVPRTIENLLQGKKAIVHGNGSYVRNWIHVLDNVEALYTIIDSGELNESYHVSSAEEFSVRQVVEKVCMVLDLEYDSVVDSSSDRSGADQRYALDCKKTQRLGWRPIRNFDKSLIEMIETQRNTK